MTDLPPVVEGYEQDFKLTKNPMYVWKAILFLEQDKKRTTRARTCLEMMESL